MAKKTIIEHDAGTGLRVITPRFIHAVVFGAEYKPRPNCKHPSVRVDGVADDGSEGGPVLLWTRSLGTRAASRTMQLDSLIGGYIVPRVEVQPPLAQKPDPLADLRAELADVKARVANIEAALTRGYHLADE